MRLADDLRRALFLAELAIEHAECAGAPPDSIVAMKTILDEMRRPMR